MVAAPSSSSLVEHFEVDAKAVVELEGVGSRLRQMSPNMEKIYSQSTPEAFVILDCFLYAASAVASSTILAPLRRCD